MAHRTFGGMAVEIALVVAFLLWPAKVPADNTSVHIRGGAPDFTLTDSKGSSLRLSDYKGKVVLLNFWATWCHGCKLEIPWFIEFENRYKGSGLAVIGVSMDDDGWKSVKPYIEQNRINYAVVIGGERLGKLYGVRSMPMTLLIGRDGKVAHLYTGVVDKKACESEIVRCFRLTQRIGQDDAALVAAFHRSLRVYGS
jgi:peroxiredoxin